MKLKFNWKRFGKDVRANRETLGFGLRECAGQLGIHYVTWCRAEHGKPITTPQYIFLCEWMQSDPLSYAISAPRPR